MIKESLIALMNRLEDININKLDFPPGAIKTGFKELDEHILGVKPQESMLIAARPGMGLTSLAVSMASHLIRTGGKVLLISHEKENQLIERLVSGIGRIERRKILSGRITDRDLVKFAIAVDDISKAVEEKRLAFDLSIENPDLVILDCVPHRIIDSNYPLIRMMRIDSASLESRPNKRPMIRDFTDDLIIDVNHVAFLYRDEVYNWESEDKGIGELILAKSRTARPETFRLGFIPEYGIWANLKSQEKENVR